MIKNVEYEYEENYIRMNGKNCTIENTKIITGNEEYEIMGLVEYYNYNEDIIILDYIYIEPMYRRNHLATDVIFMVKGSHVLLGSALSTEEAINFWKNIGVEFDEELPDLAIECKTEDDMYAIPFIFH